MKTLKTHINESVFDVDTYTDIKTRKPIFGTLSEVEIQGDGAVYIKCLDLTIRKNTPKGMTAGGGLA